MESCHLAIAIAAEYGVPCTLEMIIVWLVGYHWGAYYNGRPLNHSNAYKYPRWTRLKEEYFLD